MQSSRLFQLLTVGYALLAFVSGCAGMQVHQVPHTEAMRHTSIFGFTVSPDNRWVLFFERDPRDTDPDLDSSYGLLCVLDTVESRLHKFPLKPDQAPRGIFRSAAWSDDSTYCVLMPPPSRERSVLFDLRNGPQVHIGRVSRRNDRYFFSDDAREMEIPARLTCSDCPDVENFREFVRGHLPQGHRLGGSYERDTAVSADGRYLFYVRGAVTERMAIVMRDTQTGEDRDVAIHTHRAFIMNRVSASYLRPSPDGRWLAYQLSHTNGNWFADAGLHLLDLRTGQTRRIVKGVGYQMHWTSDSSRLYFHQQPGGLHYVQVNRAG